MSISKAFLFLMGVALVACLPGQSANANEYGKGGFKIPANALERVTWPQGRRRIYIENQDPIFTDHRWQEQQRMFNIAIPPVGAGNAFGGASLPPGTITPAANNSLPPGGLSFGGPQALSGDPMIRNLNSLPFAGPTSYYRPNSGNPNLRNLPYGGTRNAVSQLSGHLDPQKTAAPAASQPAESAVRGVDIMPVSYKSLYLKQADGAGQGAVGGSVRTSVQGRLQGGSIKRGALLQSRQ